MMPLLKLYNNIFKKAPKLTAKLIDEATGQLLLAEDFAVSSRTKPQDILTYFGQESIEIMDMKNGWKHYTTSNVKRDENYFLFTFFFENDILDSVNIVLSDKPHLSDFWENWSEKEELKKREYFDDWLSSQLGSKREFDWGKIGAYYDMKGGLSGVVLRYAPNNTHNK